jgi:hypothetical protein
MEFDCRRVFDGVNRNNFPLKQYIDDYPQAHFIGLYLGRPDIRGRLWSGAELLDIVIEGDERSVADKYERNIIVIDTSPVGTIDFNLAPIEKEFLINVGRAAALKFLAKRKLDNGPTDRDVSAAEDVVEKLRTTALDLRRQVRQRRIIYLAIATLVILGAFLVKLLI